MSDLVRLIRFPEQSVGTVSTRECLPGADWEHFGEAAGEVFLSRQQQAKLRLYPGSNAHLRRIAASAPDAFTCLDATECDLADGDLAAIGELDQLEQLYLDRNPRILNEGVRHLKPLHALRELSLGFTSITDDSARTIRAFSHLRALCANYCPIGDPFLKGVAGLRRLQWLFLTATDISDVGIASIRRFQDLAWLRLTRTKITDASLPSLIHLTGLRRLYVGETGMTLQGRRLLAERMPYCEVMDE